MSRRAWILIAIVLAAIGGYRVFLARIHDSFPSDRSPEGAYVRVGLAITEGHPREAFAFLETQAQWASYTIRDYRAKERERIARSFPEPDRSRLIAEHESLATAPDGADVWERLAEARGWTDRLRRDLSGVTAVEIAGDRATVVTARGTRYAFRRRDNGIWGLTMFTGELMAEADKASRDWDVVKKAADDYDRVAKP